MSFEGVKITKLEGGLGRTNPADDGVMALVVALSTLPSEIDNYKPYKLIQARDAELLGFNESFDANQLVLVNHHINEFFTYSPEGTLYLICVPDEIDESAAKPEDIANSDDFKAAIRQAASVKSIGFVGFAPAIGTVATSVAAIQDGFITDMAAEKRLIDNVMLEAIPAADVTGVTALPDLRDGNAGNVSVCIAQDPKVAAIDNAYENYVAIGAALGMLSVRQVNENLGSVNILQKPQARRAQGDYPLTIADRWTDAAISNGVSVTELTGVDKKSLTDKGYIFAGSYDGYGGVFFNDAPTATGLESDYAYIENNRVWNKAARRIRAILLPEIKGVVKKDPQTGYIKSTSISRWTTLVNAGLEMMLAADEISGYDCYIDPKQILSSGQPLIIRAQIVMDDIVHEMDVELGLVSKLN